MPLPTMRGTWNFVIYQGGTFRRLIDFPLDLAGCTLRMRIVPEGDLPNIELTAGNGKLMLLSTGAISQVQVLLSESETEGYTWHRGEYDFLITHTNGDVLPWLQGTITVSPRAH